MIIKTEKFEKYSRMVYMSYDKTSRIRSHLYLDFANNRAVAKGINSIFSFSFDHDGTEMKNFFVSTPEFLALCEAYTELTITEKENGFYFSSEGENFKISTFVDQSPDIEVDDLEEDSTIELVVKNSDLEKLNHSLVFMGEESSIENLAGLKLSNHIYSADGSRLYEANMSWNTELKPEISIDSELVQLMVSIPLQEDENILFYITENGNIVIQTEDVFCVSSELSNLGLSSNFNDPEFISKYNHPDFVIVDKNMLKEKLIFFAPFVSNEKNERLIMEVASDDSISIQAKGLNIGNRYVKIKSGHGINNIIGTQLWISRPMLLDAIRVINDEEIKIQIGNKPDDVAYNITGGSNSEVHVSNVLLQ